MYRLYYLTFFGTFRGTHEQEHHLHESPPSMTIPLWILGILSLVGGLLNIPHGWFHAPWSLEEWLHPVIPELSATRKILEIPVSTETMIATISTLIAIAGWWIARSLYLERQLAADEAFERSAPAIAHGMENKWYVDELYGAVIVRPLEAISQFFWRVVDAIIDGIAAMLGFIVRGVRRSASVLPDRQRAQLRADVLHRRGRVRMGAGMTAILSATLWLPIAAAVIVAFIPQQSDNAIKGLGLLASIATFVVSLGIVTRFQEGVAGYQLVETHPWIPQWGITYSLGVDGISLWLVLLTTLLTPVVMLSSWNTIHKHPKEYVISFLIMEAAMIGVFVATDLILFYVFFELTLLPMYLIIGVWGGANRIYAAIKFFLFTIAGSLLMLFGIIYLGFQYYHATGHPDVLHQRSVRGRHVAARADAAVLRVLAGVRDQGAALPAAHVAA